jgi:periplasmic protein TonB
MSVTLDSAPTYWIKPHQWSLGLCLAVVLHAGVAGAVLWQNDPPPGAVSAGTGGIEVSLGPIGGSPGSAVPVQPDVSEAEMVEAPVETVTPQDPPPDVQTIEPPPPPQEVIEIAEAVDVVDVQEPITPPEPEEVLEIISEELPVMPEKPPEPQRPKPQEKPIAQKPVTEQPETPKPVEAPAVQTAEPNPVQEVQTASAPAAVSGNQGKAGHENSREAGSADAQAAGGIPGSTADYIATLQAWLARHKEYPRSAQKRGQEGTALLYFVIDRYGRVLEHRLRQSSGYRVLDKEVMAMIERAQPLPSIPDDMPMQQMELVLPVQFFLRQ